MSIQINRFQKFQIREKQIAMTQKTAVAIKDHTTDKVIRYINAYDNLDDNLELADEIITAIEENILEKENED